jgi:hypothetical protein
LGESYTHFKGITSVFYQNRNERKSFLDRNGCYAHDDGHDVLRQDVGNRSFSKEGLIS